MDFVVWLLIIALFLLSFIGLIYPILPSSLLIIAGILLYGFYFSFSKLSLSFWIVEGILLAVLFLADYLANAIGIKRVGGSKAAGWGSTIGLIAGPFIIPYAGIIFGPFFGAVIAELLIHRKSFKESVQVGLGSLLGLVSSTIAKGLIQLVMMIFFFFKVF